MNAEARTGGYAASIRPLAWELLRAGVVTLIASDYRARGEPRRAFAPDHEGHARTGVGRRKLPPQLVRRVGRALGREDFRYTPPWTLDQGLADTARWFLSQREQRGRRGEP